MREPDDKYLWELEPRRAGKCAAMREAFRSADHDGAAERKARRLATILLTETDGLSAIGIYVSHPTPGPVRRYVGEVTWPYPTATP
jgi:hypothetical protein